MPTHHTTPQFRARLEAIQQAVKDLLTDLSAEERRNTAAPRIARDPYARFRQAELTGKTKPNHLKKQRA